MYNLHNIIIIKCCHVTRVNLITVTGGVKIETLLTYILIGRLNYSFVVRIRQLHGREIKFTLHSLP